VKVGLVSIPGYNNDVMTFNIIFPFHDKRWILSAVSGIVYIVGKIITVPFVPASVAMEIIDYRISLIGVLIVILRQINAIHPISFKSITKKRNVFIGMRLRFTGNQNYE
jgi:hypothetical protein